MGHLSLHNLILVGNKEDQAYFQSLFQSIHLVENNEEALQKYEENEATVVFLSCHDGMNNAVKTAQKIREHDRKTSIVFIAQKLSSAKLIKALSLHLSGCIQKPFKEKELDKVFENIRKDLALFYGHRINLVNNYQFDKEALVLYSDKNKEIKLTKNEIKFMKIMSHSNEPYISTEVLEHTIWEEESAHADCNPRLKHLIYVLRKKLPKRSILNAYQQGYKLVTG
ncbi:MAG: Putative two-component response regulator [uncultured Sulfurovum sp.]|uniref:Two-component response regulator n=1 Tax=uncultured Sulfurovum sp. TaxID=269237 RepID=A0A6S6SK78_9BACT|nr:MAG: Putative two-component response regulator [uncultured Sulfurovum sp.]